MDNAKQTQQDPEATAARIQEQIRGGEPTETAVEASLSHDGGSDGFVQQMYQQSGLENAAGMVAETARQVADMPMQSMGARLMKRARGLAMEVSEALFSGRRKKDQDKI